jgi:hypothetical protein
LCCLLCSCIGSLLPWSNLRNKWKNTLH